MSNSEIVQKLWNLCDVLRDDGINYSDYVSRFSHAGGAQAAINFLLPDHWSNVIRNGKAEV